MQKFVTCNMVLVHIYSFIFHLDNLFICISCALITKSHADCTLPPIYRGKLKYTESKYRYFKMTNTINKCFYCKKKEKIYIHKYPMVYNYLLCNKLILS